MMDFYTEIIAALKQGDYNDRQWAKLKRDLSLKYHLPSIPTNIQILLHVPEDEIELLKAKLLTKPTRTISGVTPVAIMTKPFPCPHAQRGGPCIMCPGGPNSEFGDVPQSYTGKEPATMRGIRNNFDPYLQVFNRLEQYIILGHNCEKVELILMGGTFPSFPLDYQEEFVLNAFKAMNDFSEIFFNEKGFDYVKFKDFFELPGDINDKSRIERIQKKLMEIKNKSLNQKINLQGKLGREQERGGAAKNLENEQLRNETAKVRCVALCIETRPDYGFLEQGNQMLKLGCTRVELGIQSVYDDVLKRIKRGHSTKETKKSINILKDLGFKVAGHYMPGLPGVKNDLAGMKQLFSDPNYQPDMLKIYPCMVTKGTELYQEYKEGKFQPLKAKEAAELIVEFKKFIPSYCRVQRIQRDIPTYQIAAGVEMTNLRQYMEQNYSVECRCIRCREPKGQEVNWDKVEIKVQEYDASGGKEFFISTEDTENDLLIGFCRLRFPFEFLRAEITADSALVRELHVYGTATAIGEEGLVQHHGFGKKLMAKAEEIAQEKGKGKMVVTSGIGVRQYYQKLGYQKEGVYMVKSLS